MKFSNETGQTLIEVLVGLTAAVVIISAIVSASLNALNNSEFGRDQDMATQYAQQGMEIIRNMRDLSIASLSATYLPDYIYCLSSSCTSLDKAIPQCWQQNPTCVQNVGKFIRTVEVTRDANNLSDCNATPTPTGSPQGVFNGNIKVTIKTSWSDNKCTDASNPFCHNVIISSCFSDFTIVPTP